MSFPHFWLAIESVYHSSLYLTCRVGVKQKGWHVHELYEEADETYDHSSGTCCHRDLCEFVLVGLGTAPHKHL